MKVFLDLPKWYYEKLQEVKREKGITYAETIRRALELYFKEAN